MVRLGVEVLNIVAHVLPELNFIKCQAPCSGAVKTHGNSPMELYYSPEVNLAKRYTHRYSSHAKRVTLIG